MAVVERAVAAMDAHRGEVAAVKSGLDFLHNMSCVDDKVWGVCMCLNLDALISKIHVPMEWI